MNRGVTVNDFLKTKRDEIQERLAQLAPLVEEHRQLEAAAKALAAIPTTAASRPRRAIRAPSSAHAARPRPRRGARPARGRPRGSGTRALQTLEIVKASPGITIPEIAAAMGIKQNYLYRVLPSLQKDGKISKRDRGWHATASATTETAAD